MKVEELLERRAGRDLRAARLRRADRAGRRRRDPGGTVGGGGGGGGDNEDNGGGGFGLGARPVGAYVIKNGEVTWKPAIDPVGCVSRRRRALAATEAVGGRRPRRSRRGRARPRGRPSRGCATPCRARLGPLDLADRVRGEPARAVEPALVAGALEEREERVAVPGRAMAEARALRDRSGLPRQLAAGERKILVEHVAERRDHPRGAVAPLDADRPIADKLAVSVRRPVRKAVLDHGVAAGGLGRAVEVTEGEHAARKAVRRAEIHAGSCPRGSAPRGRSRDRESAWSRSAESCQRSSNPSSRAASIVPGLPQRSSRCIVAAFSAISSRRRAVVVSDGESRAARAGSRSRRAIRLGPGSSGASCSR